MTDRAQNPPVELDAEEPTSQKGIQMNVLTRQVVGGIVMLLIGAVFSFLLTSSASAVRITHLENQMAEQRQELSAVKNDLSAGGPALLANRVNALELGVRELRDDVKDIYTVVVLKQPVQPARGEGR